MNEDSASAEWVESVWRELMPKVKKLCRAKCKNLEESDDLFQTVALKFCENSRKIVSRESVWPWIVSVIRNVHLDLVLREKRSVPLSSVAEDGVPYDIFGEEENFFFQGKTALEDSEFIARLIGVLNPLERMLVEMSFFASMTIRELSNVVGLSENAVRKRRFVAVSKMRREAMRLFEGPPKGDSENRSDMDSAINS